MDRTLKFSLVAGILTISFSIVFYFTYFLPNKDRVKQNIRSECAIWAKDKAISVFNIEGKYEQKTYDHYFERCLRERGI